MQITEISATKLPDIGIKRVAAYARVSSEKGEALHSLSAQISYYNEYISNHIGWEFVGVYADEGISGTKDSRPEFQRLLADCRKSMIDSCDNKIHHALCPEHGNTLRCNQGAQATEY